MAVRSIEEAKAEAIERMKVLKMNEKAVRDFRDDDRVNKSDHFGALTGLNKHEKAVVKEFEEKHDTVVYHVIHQFTNIGELNSLLYVSLDDSEWEMDREDLTEGQALAYVVNKTCPNCSEFGSIGVKSSFGGVIRAW